MTKVVSFFPGESYSGAKGEDRAPGGASLTLPFPSLKQSCRNDRPDTAGGDGHKMAQSLGRLHTDLLDD